MRKESYLSQPLAVEVYNLNTGTDIILRRNMELVEKEDQGTKYPSWECEEVQYRYKGTITKEEVESKFEYWWAIAEGKKEIDAIDDQAKENREPTVIERVEALESGLAELAEVMCGGEA